MNEDLSKHGLFFDYLYNLRVLDPSIAGETTDLKEKSGDYTQSLCGRLNTLASIRNSFFIFSLDSAELIEFRKIIDEFISIAETIVGEVEQEKMQAIAAQNHLKSISKQRESAQQEIQVIFICINNEDLAEIDFLTNSDYRIKFWRKRWSWNRRKFN